MFKGGVTSFIALRRVAPVNLQAARVGHRLNETKAGVSTWKWNPLENETSQAAFPSSVGDFLTPVFNVEDASIRRNLWGQCAISGLAYHPVRHRQAAIASSVRPTVIYVPGKECSFLIPNIAGHIVLTIIWCYEGPQIHWLDRSNHALFHAMESIPAGGPTTLRNKFWGKTWSFRGRSYTLFGDQPYWQHELWRIRSMMQLQGPLDYSPPVWRRVKQCRSVWKCMKHIKTFTLLDSMKHSVWNRLPNGAYRVDRWPCMYSLVLFTCALHGPPSGIQVSLIDYVVRQTGSMFWRCLRKIKCVQNTNCSMTAMGVRKQCDFFFGSCSPS